MNASIPVLKCEQVRQLDRMAIDQLGMSGLVLMENAGRGVVDVLCRQQAAASAVVCCGRGNNAGDGFVIARHLELRGWAVEVVCWGDPGQLTGDALINYELLRHSDIPLSTAAEGFADEFCQRYRKTAWVIDALLGTGSRGAARPPLDTAIRAMNQLSAQRMAVDLPSGLDADRGTPSAPTFRADHTCTFVAAKPGLVTATAQPFVGQLHCVDIGVPRRLLTDFGL